MLQFALDLSLEVFGGDVGNADRGDLLTFGKTSVASRIFAGKSVCSVTLSMCAGGRLNLLQQFAASLRNGGRSPTSRLP